MMIWPNGVEVRGCVTAPPGGSSPRCVVAIPLRDEADRLVHCLEALAGQHDATGRRLDPQAFEVVLLFNNCRDGSFELARDLRRSLPLHLSLVAVDLPRPLAHVGWARRIAMDLAAARLEAAGSADGFILTTDADSRPAAGWVSSMIEALDHGIDAVAGSIEPDPLEFDQLPEIARRRLHDEHAYGQLLCRVMTLLDPEPHDPWPRHGFHCGASMGVRLRTYRRLNGLPPEPVSEDQAFFEQVLRADGLVRHCPAARVITSCRTRGRAAGGMATTLASWCGEDGALRPSCGIEPVRAAARRLRLRGLLRRAAKGGDVQASTVAARRLGIAVADLALAWRLPTFGLAIDHLNERHQALRRQEIDAARLPVEIGAARRLVRRLEALSAAAGPRRGGTRPAGWTR